MEIIVEPISGEPFIVTVNRYLTIFSLKLKLQRLLGLPISQMVLVHNHQELGDDSTLCEYGIITGSRIQLLVSMKGGPVHAKRITLLSSQEDSAQSSAQDYEDDYYNRLTILLVDGDNLNVIQMGADSGDWEANGVSEQWEELLQQYEALHAQRRESFSAETNRLRRKVEQMKLKLQKRKKKVELLTLASSLLPERGCSRAAATPFINPVSYKQSNSYCNPDSQPILELPSIHRVSELSNAVTSQVRVPLSLPSIKPPEETRKRKPRCTVCNKRLRVLSAFVCKCKKQFCSKHRYAETHPCDYNYKEEERKLLAKNNPLVVAPKLPKI